MLDQRSREIIEGALGSAPEDVQPLTGGCVAEVYRATVAGARVAIKVDRGERPRLDLEGRMLAYLGERSRLPAPRTLHVEPRLLVLSWVEGGSAIDDGASRHAAELLADLHGVSAARFGLEFDTLIGGLTQPNPPAESWPEFFAEHRLRFMAQCAADAGTLPRRACKRVLRAADHCGRWLDHQPRPSLIHGDVWAGNVLARPGAIAGFIDPAIYHADAEVELAFIALFNCFGPAFWRRYHELRPIDPGFARVRRDVYNLYPLLVHVRLFGGGYVAQLESLLTGLGM